MRHVLVVHNPVSGIALFRPSRAKITRSLEKHGVQVTWIDTSPTVEEGLRRAIREPFERIIVIGGDGTVREVAELLIDAGKKTPLAILARGSGNILASSLGIPLFPLGHAIDFALHARSDVIDVFRINKQRICLIGAGQGYDTLFIQGAPRHLKRRIGPFAYVWSFFRTFLPYTSRRFTIIVDGTRHRVVAKLVLALNVFSIVGIPIERSVSARDGLIDVFVLNPRTVWEVLWTSIAFLTRRPRSSIPRLVAFQGTHISIRQHRGRHVQIDGEIYTDKHLDIDILPRALSIVHVKPFDVAPAHA